MEEAERVLGFRIPETLRDIYLSIGNGGFGPEGAAIIGIGRSGHDSDLGSIPTVYLEMKTGAETMGLNWPDNLLPFCEWGSQIYSCVDCNNSMFPVYISRDCEPKQQRYDLRDFVQMWVEGVSMLEIDPPPSKTIRYVNPFTGEEDELEYVPRRDYHLESDVRRWVTTSRRVSPRLNRPSRGR